MTQLFRRCPAVFLCLGVSLSAATARFDDFAAAAAKQKAILALPNYPRTLEGLKTAGDQVLATADGALTNLA